MKNPTSGALDAFVRALESSGSTVRKGWGTQHSAVCPAHDDRDPSLSFTESDDGQVLFTCHGGCERDDILSALGLSWSDVGAGRSARSKPQRRRRQRGSVYL